MDYFRILNAAGLTGATLALSPRVDDVVLGAFSGFGFAAKLSPPKDAFRALEIVPDGTGYRPSGRRPPDVAESAALQERARADHQDVLQRLVDLARSRGASCFFNNNVDLFVSFGERKLLVEAKSLNDRYAAVDRMRYGMGQLLDYSVRYRAEIGNAETVLAFGAPPMAESGWISHVLQENGVAFVALDGQRIVAGNERGRALPFFS
jgi:hypothetical protein